MIRALIVGTLYADPTERTAKNGKPFAVARASVPMGDDGRVFCSVIAFDDTATRLLQLKAGASVAMAGKLTVGIWTANDGTAKPSLDLMADEIAATTPRPKKPRFNGPQHDRPHGGEFDDLPGADDLGGQY